MITQSLPIPNDFRFLVIQVLQVLSVVVAAAHSSASVVHVGLSERIIRRKLGGVGSRLAARASRKGRQTGRWGRQERQRTWDDGSVLTCPSPCKNKSACGTAPHPLS